jgi:hypothetical protein
VETQKQGASSGPRFAPLRIDSSHTMGCGASNAAAPPAATPAQGPVFKVMLAGGGFKEIIGVEAFAAYLGASSGGGDIAAAPVAALVPQPVNSEKVFKIMLASGGFKELKGTEALEAWLLSC